MSSYSAHPVQAIYFDTSTSSVTTAWSTLSSALTGSTAIAEIYNSTTVSMNLGVGGGAAPAYTIPMTIFPSGGNGRIGLLLDAGTKLFIRAASAATASSGLVAINLHK